MAAPSLSRAGSSRPSGRRGRAEFAQDEPSYKLRYKAGDGRQVEQWWGQSALRG